MRGTAHAILVGVAIGSTFLAIRFANREMPRVEVLTDSYTYLSEGQRTHWDTNELVCACLPKPGEAHFEPAPCTKYPGQYPPKTPPGGASAVIRDSKQQPLMGLTCDRGVFFLRGMPRRYDMTAPPSAGLGV